jgi:hypothetical protein
MCLASWGITGFFCAFALFWSKDYAFRPGIARPTPITANEVVAYNIDDNKPEDYEDPETTVTPVETAVTARDVTVISLFDRDIRDQDERSFSTEAVVLGYIPGSTPGSITGLVLGTKNESGEIQYAGIVNQFAKSDDLFKQFADVTRLKIVGTPKVAPGELKAVWVDPVMPCLVNYTEQDAQGVLQDTILQAWIAKKP